MGAASYSSRVNTPAEREAVFREARAAVLAWRLRMVEGTRVVLIEHDERFALRRPDGGLDSPLGVVAAQFLRLVDGSRTVGEIIELIAEDMGVTEAVIAGKAAMAALHEFYRDGVIETLPAVED